MDSASHTKDLKVREVGVLMGGVSAEKEISERTGEAVLNALVSRGYRAHRVAVDRRLDQTLRDQPIDLAFVALHGTYGEDGCVQGLLELMGIPYTGAAVLQSALCMDKVRCKDALRYHGLRVPEGYSIVGAQLGELSDLHKDLGFPVYVKPSCQGSTVGGGRADGMASLQQRCRDALRYDDVVVVERYIEGMELAVGVLDGRALGAVEIVPRGGNYDYEAKYSAGLTTYHCPPRLDKPTLTKVISEAERAAQVLGVQGTPRVDLMLPASGTPVVLEINTLPGMTPTSLLPKVAMQAGMDFGDLCEAILARAALHKHV